MLDARVGERKGCVLVADKCGGMARVVMTMLRGLVVEIVFASRVVSVILRCGVAPCVHWVLRWAVSGVEENGYKRGLASAYKWLQVVASGYEYREGRIQSVPCLLPVHVRVCFLFVSVLELA